MKMCLLGPDRTPIHVEIWSSAMIFFSEIMIYKQFKGVEFKNDVKNFQNYFPTVIGSEIHTKMTKLAIMTL